MEGKKQWILDSLTKNHHSFHVMQRDAMVYKHAAHRCTGLTKMQLKMPAAPFLHLLLLPLSVLLYMPFTFKNALCNYCKINKFINRQHTLAIIYTAVFVLKLITKYTHHKLKASAAWLSLQSWHFLGQVDLLSRWKMANIFFWRKSCEDSFHLMLCNQIIKTGCPIKVLNFYLVRDFNMQFCTLLE